MSTTTSENAPAPTEKPAAAKPATPPPPPGPFVPLRDRLLQSDKARTQGVGTGADRELTADQKRRRNIVWAITFGTLAAGALATVRFFFPRVLFEPKTRFRIGYPTDYAIGVDTKWQQSKRIWVVRDAQGIYVIFAKCTHLGCTPDWKPTDNKFKCPCHGSGYDIEGVNFEGPAPRPMDRCEVALDPTGELIVDKAVLFPYGKWDDPRARVLC